MITHTNQLIKIILNKGILYTGIYRINHRPSTTRGPTCQLSLGWISRCFGSLAVLLHPSESTCPCALVERKRFPSVWRLESFYGLIPSWSFLHCLLVSTNPSGPRTRLMDERRSMDDQPSCLSQEVLIALELEPWRAPVAGEWLKGNERNRILVKNCGTCWKLRKHSRNNITILKKRTIVFFSAHGTCFFVWMMLSVMMQTWW